MNREKGKLSIVHWDEADRPRERMAKLGPEALSSAELLAILIGSGTPNESAVDLMRRVMADCNNRLSALGKMSVQDLCAYKGLGPAKAITLLAACELGKRRSAEVVEERLRVTSSANIYNYFLPRMQDLPTEECHVMLLNQNLRLIRSQCISRGGLTGTVVDVRVVLKEALAANATHIALCHNHPSGSPQPSPADDQLTQRMKRAAETIDIRLIDHVIVADGCYYSYSDEGRL